MVGFFCLFVFFTTCVHMAHLVILSLFVSLHLVIAPIKTIEMTAILK